MHGLPRLAQACNANLAVSGFSVKTPDGRAIRELHAAGQVAFAENYVQGALKNAQLQNGPEWHFIGPFNPTKPGNCQDIQLGVTDWEKIAFDCRQRPLECQAECLYRSTLIVKTRNRAWPEEVPQLGRFTDQPGLTLRPDDYSGVSNTPDQTVQSFRRKAAVDQLQGMPGCDTLSMGMSADLEPQSWLEVPWSGLVRTCLADIAPNHHTYEIVENMLIAFIGGETWQQP
jgi:hypothetical protein